MTYCVGILLNDGIVLAPDSRTHAGVDNFTKFCKMTVFERAGDRVLVLLSSGTLAGTQAVISVLKQRGDVTDGPPNLWTARTMFDVAVLVSDAVRDIERRDAPFLASRPLSFNASFIVGGPAYELLCRSVASESLADVFLSRCSATQQSIELGHKVSSRLTSSVDCFLEVSPGSGVADVIR